MSLACPGDEIAERVPDYHLTDAGNSERLVRTFGDLIRYCPSLKQWLIWDGHRWAPDETHKMLDFATRAAKLIFVEASTADTVDEREAIAKWAMRSESLPSRRAMIDGAVYMVPVRAEELDARPNLFNCRNGTLDLNSFEFREHRKEDLLTKLSGVEYDPGATCPLWEDHMRFVFCGEEDLIRGFQSFAGYCLLQNNPEQIMALLWGGGKNAKSETMRTIALILHEYATNIASETVMMSKFSDGARARPDVLKLKGARLATVTEPEQNAVLGESLIKSVTGDFMITARPLYGRDPIEFEPGAKIVISTNHLPRIRGTDDGIWRRIWLFPFLAVVPPEKRRPEYGQYLFEQEARGIFQWMLAGLRRYRETGKLDQPSAVRDAIRKYRIESSPISLFISERCATISSGRVAKQTLYENYTEWCESKGWTAWNVRQVGRYLKKIFDDYSDGRTRYWIGIRLKTDAELLSGDVYDEELLTSEPRPDTTDTEKTTFPISSTRSESCKTSVSCVSDQGEPLLPLEILNGDKSKVPYSPDPTDYATLRHTEFGQRCVVCGNAGVTHRERPMDFNRKRGTSGLCSRCFEALEVRP